MWFLLKQLIKWALIDSCFSRNLLGSTPNAMAVVKAIVNNPQSAPPFCL